MDLTIASHIPDHELEQLIWRYKELKTVETMCLNASYFTTLVDSYML